MQAVAALCHFCENHGPRVVMVTQPMRDLTLLDLTPSPRLFDDDDYGSHRSEYLIDEWKKAALEDDPRCEACSSFQGYLGLCTNDTVSHINYVSSQVPVNERVHHLMKNACLRSLSCEITGTADFPNIPSASKDSFQSGKPSLPTRSVSLDIRASGASQKLDGTSDAESNGIVLFGDDYNGYTLAHTFRLRDAKARGFQRWFSLVIVCMDKFLLTSNYDYFVFTMSSIISQLQEQATNVYRKERNVSTNEAASAASVLKNSTLPGHFLKFGKVASIELDTSRPLSRITDDSEIFAKLHRQLTFLLRTHSRLHLESVLEGVPSQDLLVRSELDATEMTEVRTEAENCTQYYALLRIARTQQIAKKLKQLESIQGVSPVNLLLNHLVQGCKIIVKCDDISFTKQFLLALFDLLPVGCARFAYRKTFEGDKKYNLFGCPTTVKIPRELTEAFVLFLNIEPEVEEIPCSYNQPSTDDEDTLSTHSLSRMSSACAEEIIMIDDFHLRAQTVSSIVDKAQKEYSRCTLHLERVPKTLTLATPTIVERYCQLLLDDEIPIRVLEAVIKDTREHWLKQAKLIYQIKSQKEKIDIKNVIRIVRCSSNDLPMLEHWQAGLSQAYKQHIQESVITSRRTN